MDLRKSCIIRLVSDTLYPNLIGIAVISMVKVSQFNFNYTHIHTHTYILVFNPGPVAPPLRTPTHFKIIRSN